MPGYDIHTQAWAEASRAVRERYSGMHFSRRVRNLQSTERVLAIGNPAIDQALAQAKAQDAFVASVARQALKAPLGSHCPGRWDVLHPGRGGGTSKPNLKQRTRQYSISDLGECCSEADTGCLSGRACHFYEIAIGCSCKTDMRRIGSENGSQNRGRRCACRWLPER
jgi:hypothetical protein